MNNKRKIKKSSQHEKEHNLVNIFKDKFLDLCFRLDNLSDSNPGLVARLLFDLIECRRRNHKVESGEGIEFFKDNILFEIKNGTTF